jgi:hypothetical protein
MHSLAVLLVGEVWRSEHRSVLVSGPASRVAWSKIGERFPGWELSLEHSDVVGPCLCATCLELIASASVGSIY